MRLTDVLWVTMSVACLVLGGIHAHVWLRRREAIVTRANLAFAVLALSVALMGVLELQMFRAASVEEFKRLLFWYHFPVWSGFAAVVAFTHFYLDAGRLWLGLTGIGLRTVALIVGALTGGAMNYQRIEALGTFDLLGDPVVMVVEASPSPVLLLSQSALLLLALFLADATRQLWRRGDRVRALTISGGLLLYVGVNSALAIASYWGFLRLPLIGIVFFVPMVFVMAAYLGIDLLRGAELKQDLQESERRLSLAADAADAGLWSLDAVSGRFWATPRAYAIFDIPVRPDVAVDDLLAVIHPHDRRRVERVLQSAREEDGVSNLDYRIRDRSGGTRWVSSRGSSYAGREVGSRIISGVVMDISARKQAEDERALQRVELEHLARVNTLAELSGTLAHEINQPLATIMSNTEAAQRLLASPRPDLDELRSIMADILAADERADAVVKRLRAMLRRGPAMREPLELDALVVGVLDFMAGELRRRGVAPRIELGAPGARLWGDRVSLEQVLINLINNACDALAVRDAGMRRLVLRTRQEGAELCVEVCDNGAGLKAGAEEIFAPFFTTKTEGLGMGLAISRSIVQAHEGRISVRNDPAGGTVFELRFPAHRPAQGLVEAR
ncbi:MAG: sensor histidine kinase [Gammaproteobacteria bacterium]